MALTSTTPRSLQASGLGLHHLPDPRPPPPDPPRSLQAEVLGLRSELTSAMNSKKAMEEHVHALTSELARSKQEVGGCGWFGGPGGMRSTCMPRHQNWRAASRRWVGVGCVGGLGG